jgi:ABC-type branched-subunit amino acid transport system ATPase component
VATLAAARIGSISPTIAVQFEFDVVTAAILGGVSFAGGAGRPLGVFVGVTTIGILNAGVLFVGLDNSYQQIAKGSLLLIALAADEISSFLRGRRAKTRPSSAATRRDGAEAIELQQTGARRQPFRSGPVVLWVKGITQRYGPIEAPKDVDFAIHAGEVVCLLGDNGAGKSSLIRIMSGAEQPMEGVISAHGEPVRFSGVAGARQLGVETVYQDLALCPNLDVIHNLVLGAEPVRRVFGLRFRDEAAAGRLARERLKRLGSLVRDHRALVRDLSGGQRQAIAIARAAGADSKLVILDEPTAALGVIQKHQVLEVIRSLADHGTAVILITHDVSMVEAVADRAVVLRLGRVVYDGKTEGLTQLDLLHLMAGEPIAAAKTEIPLR